MSTDQMTVEVVHEDTVRIRWNAPMGQVEYIQLNWKDGVLSWHIPNIFGNSAKDLYTIQAVLNEAVKQMEEYKK